MSELRLAFVKVVEAGHVPVAQACRQLGISRETGSKWLPRARPQPAQPLVDQSRRPLTSPRRTRTELEPQILDVRDRFGWGGRQIRAFLQQGGGALPRRQTVQQVLARHDRVPATPAEPPALQRWEHPAPNHLWQLDFKGPFEVARQRLFPVAILDDPSRYWLTRHTCRDCTRPTAWDLGWETFAAGGRPERLLSDNALGTRGPKALGVSWFEARLIRRHLPPWHGRP
jgi:hypothetical protein